MKYYVEVVFAGSQKRFLYMTNLELEVGKYYNIEADKLTRYSNPVRIVRKLDCNMSFLWPLLKVREITAAEPCEYTNRELMEEVPGLAAKVREELEKKFYEESFQRTNKTKIEKKKTSTSPNNPIKKVIFNYKKGITTVLWKDDVKTMLKLHPDDKFDEEKVLALAYMKRYMPDGYELNELINDTLANTKEIR